MATYRVVLARTLEDGKVGTMGKAEGEIEMAGDVYTERLRVNYETTQKSVNTELTFEVTNPGGFGSEADRDRVVAEAQRLMGNAITGAAAILNDNKAKQGL